MADIEIKKYNNEVSNNIFDTFINSQEVEEMQEVEELQENDTEVILSSNCIEINISGLKSVDKFIGLGDTPLYYENGKFFKVDNNKIIYTNINWSDITGDIKDNEQITQEIIKLIEGTSQELISKIVINFIDEHNANSASHPYIINLISDTENKLNNKIDLLEYNTNNTISELTEIVNENYTTLDTKIDTTKSELNNTISELTEIVNENYTTLGTKIDTTKSELSNTISELTETVNENYTTLDTKIDTTKSELNNTISELTETVNENYTTLDTKIDTTKSELNNTISELTEIVNENYTTLDTKIDTTKSELNNTISELTEIVNENYTTLDTKIDTTKSELNNTISELTETLDTKIDTTKSELNNTISALTETVNENYTTLDTNKANKATTLSGYGIEDAYTKTEIDEKISRVYRIKGSVNTFEDLPKDNLIEGDVYNILSNGVNYVWTEAGWDKFSETIDLSPITESIENLDKEINTKQDILTAGDGINIENGVISSTQISAQWGNIQGNITEQTDLQTALDGKQATGDYALKSDIPTNFYTQNETDILLDTKTNTNLSNLSEIGNDKLNISKMYLTNSVSEDTQGFNQLKDMYHSTFDLNKFEVVGSPTITSDGVASGFSGSDYIYSDILVASNTIKIRFAFIYKNNESQQVWLKLVGTTADNNLTDFEYGKFSSAGNMYIRATINGVKNTYIYATNSFSNNWTDGDLIECEFALSLSECTGLISNTTKSIGAKVNYTYSVDELSFNRVNIGGHGTISLIDLKQFSITVDDKEVFNGNKTGLDIIKQDNYTIVGSPNITGDGVVSGFSGEDCLALPYIFNPESKPWEIIIKAKMDEAGENNYRSLLGSNILGTDNQGIALAYRKDGTGLTFWFSSNGASWDIGSIFGRTVLDINKSYYIKVSFNGSIYEGSVSEDGKTWISQGSISSTTPIFVSTQPLAIGDNKYSQNKINFWKGSIDLNAFKIYVDGNLVYQPCLKIPYTESKTGSKIVDVTYRDRVKDAYEQRGKAIYYTIDEENKNFTLPMGEIYGMIEDKQYQLDDKVSLTKDEIITGQKTFEKDITTNGNNVNIMPTSGDGSIAFSDGERIRFAQGGQTVISSNNTSIYLRTKSNRDGANQVELKTDGTLSATKFKGPLDGIATQATKDSGGLQINTTYMRKTIGTQYIPHTPTAPTSLEMVGKQGCGNGNIAGGNLVTLHKNTLYKCNERGSTITCNYDDKVANLGKTMCDGSFSGHYTAINPSTSFISKPFTWEVTSSSQYEVSDVCRLHIYSHRLTDPINVTKFKIEAYIHDTLTNSKKWITAYEYSGNSINIAQTGYGLYKTGYSSNNYYPIYGIRLTILESPDTVFRLSEIQLVASRGTETIQSSLHCLSDAGGTVWGNLEVTGTVDGKCTKDGSGNIITDTYAKKTDLDTKQNTLTAGNGIKIEDNVISNTITDTKVLSTVSNANNDIPILLNNGTNATTNSVLINNNICANPSTGTITAQHGKFGKRLTTYVYSSTLNPTTQYHWYKIFDATSSHQLVYFDIKTHSDVNYSGQSNYILTISNYAGTSTNITLQNYGYVTGSDSNQVNSNYRCDLLVDVDAQGNVYISSNATWECNLIVNNIYGNAIVPYTLVGTGVFGTPVGFERLGEIKNSGSMRLAKSSGTIVKYNSGIYSDLYGTADKALYDKDGNDITTTYLKQSSIQTPKIKYWGDED